MRFHDLCGREGRIIGNILRAQAEAIGNSIWLVSDDREISFAEADALTNKYANGLIALGIQPGGVIALVMEPSIEVVLLAVAASKIGAVFTTISTDFTGNFLEDALVAPEPDVLVIDANIAARLDAVSTIGGPRHIFINGAAASGKWNADALCNLISASDAAPDYDPHYLETVQVWWSSGTTGKPKGVSHCHSSLLMQTISHDRDIRKGDTLYACTPVYLGSAWTGAIWPSLVAGVRAAIDAKFSVSRFWERVNLYRATHAFTLGAMHMHLWNAPPSPDDRNNTIRRFAAIPMPYDVIAGFKERFGIENMPQGYGTSETFRVFDAPEDGYEHTGAVLGRPVKHLDVALFDENDLPVPDGEAGEICIRPREPGLIFSGYFKDPARTVESWRSLWHHTGDMAAKGPDGFYRFADRKKDYIRYKGRNMSMFEVEAIVATHPAVKDVAAFGIQSKELESESELMIAVVLNSGASASHEELARHVNDNAPHYFVPRYIDIVDNILRNDHGRLVKNALRDRGVSTTTWDQQKVDFKVVRP